MNQSHHTKISHTKQSSTHNQTTTFVSTDMTTTRNMKHQEGLSALSMRTQGGANCFLPFCKTGPVFAGFLQYYC